LVNLKLVRVSDEEWVDVNALDVTGVLKFLWGELLELRGF
jgi:hypothetical protein